MGWTKREIINQSFSEIGLANYAFDLQPEALQMALRQLDAMMARWYSKNIRIGYPLPGSPGSADLDQQTKVSDVAVEAIYMSLAMLIASGFGKTPSPDTRQAASSGYKALMAAFAKRPQLTISRDAAPAGQGNRRSGYGDTNPFLSYPDNVEMPKPGPSLEFE